MLEDIADQLDLLAAQKQAAVSSDLLPPREDDRVAGELGKRFAEHLRKELEDSKYVPDSASFVQVPKPGFTSRPAALLTLTDRVIYEALVALLRLKLGKYLLPDDVVLWPREEYLPKRWTDFERAPLASSEDFIVQADVSGFYDSIDHEHLESLLVYATGERKVARAIRGFLSGVMSSRRGVPQGLLPSDTLATAFLQPIDAALIREGFEYYRHGDDIRVAAPTVSRAREAIALLEIQLRELGLLINGAKCAIIKRADYESELAVGDALMESTREKLLARRIRRLRENEEVLIQAMEEADLDSQIGWELFYHGTIAIEDVIELLREHLEPNDVEIARQVFLETIIRAPGKPGALAPEQFHQQLTRSVVRLAAGRSPAALGHSASIIARFPDKTELVANYLSAMQGSQARLAVRQAEDVLLTEDLFTTPWQHAWLCRVLASGSRFIRKEMLGRLAIIAGDEGAHWLSRVEAMKVLGCAGHLERDLVTRSWRLAPRPYRVDLIAAAASMRTDHKWARQFLTAARQDPVEAVVVNHVTG